jgi:peroxiredoxin
MLRKALQRFATAILLVAVGLISMAIFMKSSKPEASSAGEHRHATSEDHKECAAKVAGKPLPLLALRNPDNEPIDLRAELERNRATLIIRYLGYGCSHCIEQLLALQRRTEDLKSAGVRVIAFSDDAPSENRAVMEKYGFSSEVFTLASDPAKSSARTLGAVYAEQDGSITELHVSLVVRGGNVAFAHFDSKPMMDVQELLDRARGAENRSQKN